jgi:hypothetical protein
MIYWLLFKVALFHCTVKVATNKYRSTALHDVSITNPFSAFNCAMFNSSLYVCYMWQWVMWPVYWLCWMENGQMWISILWTLCGLFNWNVLCHCAVQTEDSITNTNGSRLYNGCTSRRIHCTMNCYVQCFNQATTLTLTSLNVIFSKWNIQSVHLHNIQFNSNSTWLHSQSWIEEIEVDIWT